MVELYAAFYDHDRATATTYINDKIVVCVLENILTTSEDALVAHGARGEVIDDRVAFQTATRMSSPRSGVESPRSTCGRVPERHRPATVC